MSDNEVDAIENDCKMNRNLIKGFLLGFMLMLFVTIGVLVYLIMNSGKGKTGSGSSVRGPGFDLVSTRSSSNIGPSSGTWEVDNIFE